MSKLILSLLLLFPFPTFAGGEGDAQPVPPVLPPVGSMPTTTTTTTTTTPPVKVEVPSAPAKSDGVVPAEGATCIGRIICECTKPKEKVVYKTKIVEKPVVKTVIKYVDRVVEKTVEKRVEVPVAVPVAPVEDKSTHTFSLLAGGGPNGVYTRLYGGEYEFKAGYGAVGGVMYQYGFAGSGFGLGLGYLTSDTWLGLGSYTLGR